jgi:CheY-like chemotaxis protein
MVILRRSPGLDAIVLADALPDMTSAQVVDEAKADERLANVPIVLLTAQRDEMAAMFGDRIAGTASGAEDLAALEGPLTAELAGDRALAAGLAARAAETLYELARSGGDIGVALDELAAASSRADEVAIPAMRALALAGTAAQAKVLLGALADEARSDDSRAAAGEALARVVARAEGALGAEGVAKVQEVVRSQAAMSVRQAAARVLGNLPLPAEERAKLLQSLRG